MNFYKKSLNGLDLKKWNLRDGMSGKSFHDKCNNKGQTITLIMNEK